MTPINIRTHLKGSTHIHGHEREHRKVIYLDNRGGVISTTGLLTGGNKKKDFRKKGGVIWCPEGYSPNQAGAQAAGGHSLLPSVVASVSSP